MLSEELVAEKLSKSKKPSSLVPGDIAPRLFNLFPTLLAKPVAAIFNRITQTRIWPKAWRIEYVTVIPKGKDSQEPNECRNISCTNFLSKVYESFLLGWCREEVVPKLNHYGGEPNASATHLLVEVTSDITSTMEDNRMGMVLSTIDFSKAFNRL